MAARPCKTLAGGGVAGLVQTGTVSMRAISSGTTGGFGNFIVASFEFLGSIVTTVLAIVIPIVCFVFLLVTGVFMVRYYRRRKSTA